MLIEDYIKNHYNGSQAAFARDIGVSSQAVSKMKSLGFIVEDGRIWSARRKLPSPPLSPPAKPAPRVYRTKKRPA